MPACPVERRVQIVAAFRLHDLTLVVSRLHGISTSVQLPGVDASIALTIAPITRRIRGQLVDSRQTMAICRALRFC